MMHITLWPDLVDWNVNMQVDGLTITIDGQLLDFSAIPDGYQLPCEAVDNKWFVIGKFVERKGNDLYLTLRHPVSTKTLESIRAPEKPIVLMVDSGNVEMPSGLIEEDESVEGEPPLDGEK